MYFVAQAGFDLSALFIKFTRQTGFRLQVLCELVIVRFSKTVLVYFLSYNLSLSQEAPLSL